MDNQLVTLSGVSKKYHNQNVLQDVSFSLREGEVLGYIGPNGAGKTTTIKILVGLINQFQGNLNIDGHQLPGDRSLVHHLIGYLPQGVSFQNWHTIDSALMTLGRLSGVSDDELKERIPRWLDRFELLEFRKRKVKKLSGGMLQKVGLIQAVMHEPKLLVLDEPLGGLDPASRLKVKELIRELRNKGTTVIFSSHILSDVQDIADRIAVLNRGRLLQLGTLDELKEVFASDKDVVVEYSTLPGSRAEIESIPSIDIMSKKTATEWLIRLKKDADMDAAIHEIVSRSLSAEGRIRKIGHIPPSLDVLYTRFLEQQ